MSGIVTHNFSIEQAKKFKDSITNQTDYIYLFIGRIEPWANELSVPAQSDFVGNVKDFDKTDITVYKGFSLIPDSIFGVGLYVLIILFFIWILGDSGGECGVDYGPRFFGEC